MNFSEFTQGDWLELIGIASSLFVGIISLIIALRTLRQNSKMIEDSTRPYIVIYSKTTYVADTNFYLVIKNMGQSGAIIKRINSDKDLEPYIYLNQINPINKVENTFFAPNQSIFFELEASKIKKDKIMYINFEIEYMSNRKAYTEHYAINFDLESSIVRSRGNSKGNEIRDISYALQEMIEQNL